ncbi:hypothetical protein BaRGS_00008428 [Batillaria attramentaria]|uniref:Uncharacterized protein n=1 Tax=Batillaria attramentaria TaxID=370345 RepID=A0ABD0LLK4_9CAEN
MAGQLMHDLSRPCPKSELDIFQVPPTQTTIVEGQYVEHRPLSTLTDAGPVEFYVSSGGEDYLDLNSTYLYVQLKLVNADDSNLAADANVGPENLLLHSLWSQVDLYLNNTLVTPSTNTYPYRAYLETLLSHGSDAKHTRLQTSLWYKDTKGHMNAAHNHNAGLAARRRRVAESRTIELLGRPHLDLFQQDKLLINGVNLKIKLVRSRDAFCLHSTTDAAAFKVRLLDVSLFVRKVKVAPSVQMAHSLALEKGTAKYPMQRAVTKIFAVPQGNMQIQKENMFLGQLPRRLVIGLIHNQAFHGHYAENPYNFLHLNLNYLALHVDGRQIPAKPLQPNFTQSLYARSYLSLFEAVGKVQSDEGNDVTYEDYGAGYTLFAFDLTPDEAADVGHAQLVKHGNLRLEIHFANPLPHTINVVAHGEFQSLLEVDKHRNVLVDFAT